MASSVRVTSWCRAQGTPALRSTDFIRDLSRTLWAVSSSMPSIPSAPRTWASGTCSCSRAPTSRSTRTELTAQATDGVGDLLRIERVGHPPVTGQRIAQVGGRFSTGSVVTRPRRTPGSRAAERANLAVASSRYGATNAATTIGGG